MQPTPAPSASLFSMSRQELSTCLNWLQQAAEQLQSGFPDLPPIDHAPPPKEWNDILQDVAERLWENYPYHHPLYAGQMLKPPHPLPHLAYALAMLLNPNNHALDGGRASSTMEQEVVRQLGELFGWSEALGHLCGGGTMANLEAHWVSRELTGNRPIAVSTQAHYTHARCAGLLGVECHSISADQHGRMDVNALRQTLDQHQIGTVVVTCGTTGLGAVDPLDEILKLQEQFGFRVHVDAAYGGYFKLVDTLRPETRRQFDLLSQADSLVLDPHKHGLQPYGCGCVLFKDRTVAHVYKHDSPYTYFTSDDLHLGEISFECSRAGAAAVALWATLKLFPLTPGDDFAQRLAHSRAAALQLYDWLQLHEHLEPIVPPELDIVVWGVKAASAADSSQLARQIFELAADEQLHLALLTLPRAQVEGILPIQHWDADQVTCLRSCLMKPEHHFWLPQILTILQAVVTTVFSEGAAGALG